MSIHRQHLIMGGVAAVSYVAGAGILFCFSPAPILAGWLALGWAPCLMMAIGARDVSLRLRGMVRRKKPGTTRDESGKIAWEGKDDSEAVWQSGQYDYQHKDFRLRVKFDIVQRLVRDLVDGSLTVLDVGAGHGQIYPLLNDRLVLYHYVDISPTALETFRKLQAPDERVVAEVTDFERLHLTRQYNAILFLGFVHTHYSVAQFQRTLSHHWAAGGILIMEMTKGYSNSFPISQYMASEPLCRIEYTASYPGSDWKWERVLLVFKNERPSTE
jgi:hypothetical protein